MMYLLLNKYDFINIMALHKNKSPLLSVLMYLKRTFKQNSSVNKFFFPMFYSKFLFFKIE